MQSQELLSEGQVLEDEVLAETECGDNPAEEVSEQYNHGKNRNRTGRRSLVAKSLIVRVHAVLTRTAGSPPEN